MIELLHRTQYAQKSRDFVGNTTKWGLTYNHVLLQLVSTVAVVPGLTINRDLDECQRRLFFSSQWRKFLLPLLPFVAF